MITSFHRLMGALALVYALPLQAQLVADGGNATLAGITNSITGDVTVGTNGAFTLLTLAENVLLTNSANGVVGLNTTALSNEVRLVAGTARWLMNGSLYLGSNGAYNSMLVSNGAYLSNVAGRLGSRAPANGNRMVVTGPNSYWGNSSDVTVGFVGNGNELLIENGGRVDSLYGYISRNGSNNLAIVRGVGSVWSNSLDFYIGVFAVGNTNNRLLVESGGRVFNGTGYVGGGLGSSNNYAWVSGAGSLWSNQLDLVVGNTEGNNWLVVSNGGKVVSGFGTIGGGSSSSRNNRVTVAGAGSVWENRDDLQVGTSAAGNRLEVTDGALVINQNGYVGYSPQNLAVVSGPATLWSNRAGLFVGYNGPFNQLVVSNSATVSTLDHAVLGFNSAAHSNLLVLTGPDSRLLVDLPIRNHDLIVGSNGGYNQIVISNAATAACRVGVIGRNATSLGNEVVVTGTNSVWDTVLNTIVGFAGSGNRLTVASGGAVLSLGGVLGLNSGSAGNQALVTGSGSLWSNRLDVLVGNLGSNNSLTISSGGTVVAGTNFIIGMEPGATGNRVTVSTGGNLRVVNASGSGLLDVRRGTNVISAGLIETDNLLVTNVLGQFEHHGGTVAAHRIRISNGRLVQIGNGNHAATLHLTGVGDFNITGSLAIMVSSNSTLTGSGHISGPLTIQGGGTLAPGTGIGKVVVTNGPSLLGTLVMEVSRSGVTLTQDQLQTIAPITYGGALVVSNAGPTALTNGDSFKLFDAPAYSGSFASITLPALGPGLFWTNRLSVDGSIAVYYFEPRAFGVDVSHFQGESGVSQSSWNQMFADGKRFAFIKATEGLTGPDDAAMANNVTRATAAGLLAGVYHYAHPENRPTTNGAVQEADHFLSYAGNFIGPGYLRPVLDVEFSAATLGTTELTDWVMAFCDRVVALRGSNAAPIIYCNQAFATSEFDARLGDYDLWLRVISPGLNPATDDPGSTGVFNNWSFWQYSDTGNSGGISPLDLNVCRSEFKPLQSYVIPPLPNPVPPIIISQPRSLTVSTGSTATFSVSLSVTSSPPLFHQWRFNGTNIASANQPSYTRTNVQFSDAGGYSVLITNAAGAVTSSVAMLTMFAPITLYAEDFDSYSTPSVVSTNTATNGFNIFWSAVAGPLDFQARFGFDYSTLMAPAVIPPAPHSVGTTKGLALSVNKDATAAAAAVNLYPISQVFTGDVAFKCDLWINWTNAAGSTEHALFGINHSGSITNRVELPTSDGLFFAVSGDGGSSGNSTLVRDYAVFRGGGWGASPVLLTTGFGPAPLLGAQFDNNNAGFSALFPSKSVTAFNTPAGSAGLGWLRVEVRQESNLITWLLNNTLVAQYTNTTDFTNGTFMIGYNDVFDSLGSPANFALFDNLRVETLGPDYDGDGLLDQWEMQYIGNLSAEPGNDTDGDGATDGQEFLAGTNPTNSASLFRFQGATVESDDLVVTWAAVGGRSYVVQHAAGMASSFSDISPVITVPGIKETITSYTHFGAATNSTGFYRIRLQP